MLGLMIGSVMRGLRWGRDHLEEARTRTVGLGTDDREEGGKDVGTVSEINLGKSERRD